MTNNARLGFCTGRRVLKGKVRSGLLRLRRMCGIEAWWGVWDKGSHGGGPTLGPGRAS